MVGSGCECGFWRGKAVDWGMKMWWRMDERRDEARCFKRVIWTSLIEPMTSRGDRFKKDVGLRQNMFKPPANAKLNFHPGTRCPMRQPWQTSRKFTHSKKNAVEPCTTLLHTQQPPCAPNHTKNLNPNSCATPGTALIASAVYMLSSI
jgi:hypothetical protein